MATGHRADALAKLHRPLSRELELLLAAVSDARVPTPAREFAAYSGIRRALFAEDRALARQFAENLHFDCRSNRSLAAHLVSLIFAAEFGSPRDVTEADAALSAAAWEEAPLSLRCGSLRFRAHALRMSGFIESN